MPLLSLETIWTPTWKAREHDWCHCILILENIFASTMCHTVIRSDPYQHQPTLVKHGKNKSCRLREVPHVCFWSVQVFFYKPEIPICSILPSTMAVNHDQSLLTLQGSLTRICKVVSATSDDHLPVSRRTICVCKWRYMQLYIVILLT